MESATHHIANERRRRRLGYRQLQQEDRLRSELGGDPRTALLTGTKTEKERAVGYYAITGQRHGLEGANLSNLDLRQHNLNGFNLRYAALNHTRLGRASGASFDYTRSVGLEAAGSDLSGSSWNFSLVIKGDMRRSNRRNMQANTSFFAFTDSRGSDSENFQFSGIGFMNNHADETLTNAKFKGWHIASNFNNAYAPGAEISGRAQGSDFSRMNIAGGSFKVRDHDFTLHATNFDGATVDFCDARDAASADLDQATIVNDVVAAKVEESLATRALPSAKYDVLKTLEAAAPTPARTLQARRRVLPQLAA